MLILIGIVFNVYCMCHAVTSWLYRNVLTSTPDWIIITYRIAIVVFWVLGIWCIYRGIKLFRKRKKLQIEDRD